MNPPDTTFWLRLFGIVALEITFIFAAVLAANFLIKSISWRKALWQTALVSSLLVVAANLTGIGNGLARWLAGEKPPERKIVARMLPKNESFIALPAEPETALTPVVRNETELLPQAVWWPGIVWCIGFAVVGMRISFARALLLVLCRRRAKNINEAFLDRVSFITAQFGIRREVRLLKSETIKSPIAFGIVRPSIALPANFETSFTALQQDAMLAHELAHLAARDPFWYLLADWMTALLWWHPLVWWARRRLHITSELAADEATAFLENGPSTLAECLVNLGRELSVAPSFGWLGIEGSFRSALGQRVERLLNLRGRIGQPHRWKMFVTKMALTFFLAGSVAFSSGWMQNKDSVHEKTFRSTLDKAWSDSFAAGLLLAAREDATGPEILADLPKPEAVKADVNSVLAAGAQAQDSKVLSETGKVEVAVAPETKPAEPVQNESARGTSIARNESPAATSKTVSDPSPKNIVFTSPQRKAILAKLNNIVLPEVAFDGLPLPECLKFLARQSTQLDPDKTGVNFMIRPKPDSKTDLNSVLVQITQPLKNLRLADAIDAIVQSADKQLHYEIADYAVIFAEGEPAAEPLFTRTFKVNPQTVMKTLSEFYGLAEKGQTKPGPLTGDFDNKRNFVTKTNSTSQWNETLRLYFSDAGVDLNPPKSLFFNDRSGAIFTRATLKELETIEAAVQTLNEQPPQVTIEVKFAEMDEATVKALGLDWFSGNSTKTATNVIAGSAFKKSAPSTVSIDGRDVPNSVATNITGILTEPQFKIVLDALEQRKGVDVLTSPKVTTLSGRQAQIATLDMRTIVTGLETVKGENGKSTNTFQTTPMAFGPTLDVIPFVSADGFSIQMTIIATVNEFIGYDEPDKKLKAASPNAQLPLPRTRVRQATTSAVVFDRQTIVLSGITSENQKKMNDKVPLLGDLPLVGRLFRSQSSSVEKRHLMIFVTPTVIDSAGNAVHTTEDFPRARTSIPPQPTRE